MLTRKNERQRVEQELLEILDLVAGNGWFPWHGENADGSKDHNSLRLVSKGVKKLVDQPSHGGPDFGKIFALLDNRNRFDMSDESGFCHHCHEFWNAPEDERCDTCAVYKGEWHEDCECKKDHRFGPVLLKMDPRLQKANFAKLSLRERVKKLLGFHQWCVSNFLKKFPRAGMYGDLGAIDSNMINLGGDFSSEMAQYNTKTNNFMCNLMFIGWAHKGLSLSAIPPGTYDPYRSAFLGQLNAEDWNGGHRETFHEISTCFVECHQPAPGEKPLSPDGWRHCLGEGLTLSQIQFIPEIIRRCVRNSVDTEAKSLLGYKLASSIDLYLPARETLHLYEGTNALQIKWMPGFGMSKEDYVPLTTYEGYNPQHDHITCTGLEPGLEPFAPPNDGGEE